MSYIQLSGDHAVCALSKAVKMEERREERFQTLRGAKNERGQRTEPMMIFQQRVIAGDSLMSVVKKYHHLSLK